MREDIVLAAQRVYAWMRSKDFHGHDPHDLLESPFVRPFSAYLPKILRLAILQAGRRSPLNLHTLFLVPQQINAKGIALILSSLTRAKEEIDTNWKEVGSSLAAMLLSSGVRRENTIGWGYPFAWQSRTHFLPKNYPTIVTTSFVGRALLDLYQETHDQQLLDTAIAACRYITRFVSRTEEENGFAFGYAENDPQIVFNASLLGAELLARTGEIAGSEEYLLSAYKAAKFVVQYQRQDGSWQYGLESNQGWVDSFHTAFVLHSLEEISRRTYPEQFATAVKEGYSYYKTTFFEADGTPKYFHNRTYPVDAHAAGTAIETLSYFGDTKLAHKVALRSIDLLQSPNGYFYYQRLQKRVNPVPYMRWSNAWMLRGLTEYLSRV